MARSVAAVPKFHNFEDATFGPLTGEAQTAGGATADLYAAYCPVALTASKLAGWVIGSAGEDRTLTLLVDEVDTALVAAIPDGGRMTEGEDGANSVQIPAGSMIVLRGDTSDGVTFGAATRLVLRNIEGPAVSLWATPSVATLDSTTRVWPVCGEFNNATDIGATKLKTKLAGTWRGLYMNVTANASTGSGEVTVDSRLGSDGTTVGNQSITIGVSDPPGLYIDTTNTDDVPVDDWLTYGKAGVAGASVGISMVGSTFVGEGFASEMFGYGARGITAASLPYYMEMPCGDPGSNNPSTDGISLGFAARLSNLRMQHFTSSITEELACILMVNGQETALQFIIPASAAEAERSSPEGVYVDVAADDLLQIMIRFTGATTGSGSITHRSHTVTVEDITDYATVEATGTITSYTTVIGVTDAPPQFTGARGDVSIIAIEISGAIDAAGTEQVFYLSDRQFVTQPSDSPANVSFDESLLDPGSIGISAFSDGRTSGGTRLALGEIRIANSDGQYDGWLDYGFDGRRLVVRRGPIGPYPANFPELLSGTVEALTVSRSQVVIRLRDKQLLFDQPVLTNTYAGTNVLPDGIEGTASDLKGRVKPRLFGKASNIQPPCVNTSKLVYQISDGAINSVEAVYDRGAALTAGADHSTSALLLAATVAGSTYATCLNEGLIRLGSSPAGTITADATQGASANDRTAGQLLRTLALDAGLGASEVSSSDISALDITNPPVLGYWASGTETYAKIMDLVAASFGGQYGFDAPGVLRAAVLSEPAASSVLDIEEYDVLDGFERRIARDGDIPSWSHTIRYGRNWTVQTTDLAGSVSSARRAELAQDYKSARAEDAAIKARYLLAAEMSEDTLLTAQADAEAEAARRLALRKVHRNTFDVPVDLDLISGTDLKIMDTVKLTHPRFGLDDGVLLRVIGMKFELARKRVVLTVWG